MCEATEAAVQKYQNDLEKNHSSLGNDFGIILSVCFRTTVCGEKSLK